MKLKNQTFQSLLEQCQLLIGKNPAEFSLRGCPYLSHSEAKSKILSTRFPEADFHSPSLYFLRSNMCDLYALKCKKLFK